MCESRPALDETHTVSVNIPEIGPEGYEPLKGTEGMDDEICLDLVSCINHKESH